LSEPPVSVSNLVGDDGLYQSLTEAIPVQIWAASPDGHLDYVSEQTARILGCPVEALLTEGWQRVVHPDDLPLAVERWTHALAHATPYETEFRLRIASGEYTWYLARAVPHLNADGQVIRWFGTNTDIEKERQKRSRVQTLLSKLQKQTRQLEEQNQLLGLEVALGAVLGSDQPQDDLLADAVELIVSHLQVAHCCVWVLTPAGESLQCAGKGADAAKLHGIPLSIGVKLALGEGIPGDREWVRREKITNFVTSPLKIGETTLGCIGIWSLNELSQATTLVMGSIANTLAQNLARHRATERIRLSEAWLSTTLSSIGDGVIATDSTGLVTYANPVAQGLTGWTEAECVGLHLDSIFRIVNETTRMPVESPVAKVLREGMTVGMANHTVLLRPDGSELSIEDSAAPIRSSDGTLNGIVLVFRDATEKRTAERERAELLRASREAQKDAKEARDHLHALFMQAPAAICVLRGSEHIFELSNPHYTRLVGDRNVVGMSVRAALPELAGQEFFERLDQVFTTGERFEGKDVAVTLVRKHGELGEAYLDFVYEPMLNQAGQVDGVLVLATNVTEKVEARRALEKALAEADRLNRSLSEAESLLRRLVDNLPELAWSARPDGYIDFYNRRWFDYTGRTAEDMLGWGWSTVHDPATLGTVIERWEHSIKTGERFEMEFPLRGADGNFRWFLTRVEPLRDSSDNIVRWFGTNTDIHRQREEGQKAAEANTAKDEFLATASHELRNPLSAILGWARLLRSGSVDQSMFARGLETIERNANAQVQLIDDILDGSRIIAGNLRLEVKPLDLGWVVQTAVEAVRPASNAKQIQITTNLNPTAGHVVGDAERLQQIVWNLLNNAVKFTPNGGKIEISLTRPGTHTQLTVSDSGEGIAPEFLPYIFDRFRQADASSTRRHGGLGLGLALVRYLVEAHGGTVTAASEGIGRGARFTVHLPVGALDVDPEVTFEPNERSSVRHAILDGVEVLVVDDEADGRDLVATVLRMHGAKVIAAGGAGEALDLFLRNSVSVIVSDLGMPGMDGFELMRRIRSLPGEAGAQVRAIALSAYVREQDRSRAVEAGFQKHVGKPVEPAELVRVVAELAAPRPV